MGRDPYDYPKGMMNGSDTTSSRIQEFLKVLEDLPDLPHVRFIMLYGSVAEGTNDHSSDIDIAISTDLGDLQADKLRMHILGRVSDKFDVHIFEQLPIFVQINVFKGTVLYVTDEDALYDTAYRTMREYELFRPHYLDYIGERAL